MPLPQITDNEDELLAAVRALHQAVGGGDTGGGGSRTINQTVNKSGGSRTVNQTTNRTVNVSEPTEDNTAEYFSTGESPIKVTDTSYTDPLPFGFMAKTINIRTTEDIVLRFKRPTAQGTGKDIFVSGDSSPFTIGGNPGLDTAYCWIKKADSAANDPLIRAIAYR